MHFCKRSQWSTRLSGQLCNVVWDFLKQAYFNLIWFFVCWFFFFFAPHQESTNVWFGGYIPKRCSRWSPAAIWIWLLYRQNSGLWIHLQPWWRSGKNFIQTLVFLTLWSFLLDLFHPNFLLFSLYTSWRQASVQLPVCVFAHLFIC